MIGEVVANRVRLEVGGPRTRLTRSITMTAATRWAIYARSAPGIQRRAAFKLYEMEEDRVVERTYDNDADCRELWAKFFTEKRIHGWDEQ